MKKNIYINGASYCNGFLLENYMEGKIHEKSWLGLLINKLTNYNFIYEIKNGKGLSKIYFETMLFLSKNHVDDIILVIPGIFKERKNYYLVNSDTNKYEHVDIVNYEHLLKLKKDYEFSENLIDFFYFKDEENFILNNFIKQIEMLYLLINYIKNKNINFNIFIDTFHFYNLDLININKKLEEKEKEYIKIISEYIKNNIGGMMDEVLKAFNYDYQNHNKLFVTKPPNHLSI